MVGDGVTEADLQLKSIRFLEICGNQNSYPSLSYFKFFDFQWEKDTCFSCSDVGCDEKIRKDKEELNTIINQKNLIIIYTVFTQNKTSSKNKTYLQVSFWVKYKASPENKAP